MIPQVRHTGRIARRGIVGVVHGLQRGRGHVVKVEVPLKQRLSELLVLELVLRAGGVRDGQEVRVGHDQDEDDDALHGH